MGGRIASVLEISLRGAIVQVFDLHRKLKHCTPMNANPSRQGNVQLRRGDYEDI